MPDNQTLQDHNDDLMAQVADLMRQLVDLSTRFDRRAQQIIDLRTKFNDANRDAYLWHKVVLRLAAQVLADHPEMGTSPGQLASDTRLKVEAIERATAAAVYPSGHYAGD